MYTGSILDFMEIDRCQRHTTTEPIIWCRIVQLTSYNTPYTIICGDKVSGSGPVITADKCDEVTKIHIVSHNNDITATTLLDNKIVGIEKNETSIVLVGPFGPRHKIQVQFAKSAINTVTIYHSTGLQGLPFSSI